MLTAGLLNNKLKYLHMIDITNPRKFRGYSEIIFDNDLIKQLTKQKQKNDRSITKKKFMIMQSFVRHPLLADGKKFVIKSDF